MKTLRIVFATLYAVIIALLLLMLVKCEPTDDYTVIVDPPFVDSIDSDDIDRIIHETSDRGKLKISLLWDLPGDVDLHVIEPNGTHLSYSNTRSHITDGYLDHDDQYGGRNSIENVYWDQPQPGRYKLFIHYFSKASGNGDPIPCKVVVFKEGQVVSEYSDTLTHVEERHNFPDVVVD